FNFAIDVLDKTIERAFELDAYELISGLLIMRGSCRQNAGIFSDKDDILKSHARAETCLTEVVQLLDLRSQARDLEIKAAAVHHFAKILAHPLIKCNITKLRSLRAKSLR